MSETLQAFVRRVEAFEIDPGEKVLRFADRLARENDWSLAFAERVIREYKRFCILAMRAGHPVTPSEQVDQAWHLHLTYTRSYWERFCRDELGGPLHHEPTAGGSAEGHKFRDWYQETLDSYERFFDERPPVDIWPSPENRFKHAGDWKWVNVGRYWMFPKSRAWLPLVATLLLLLSLTVPGCGLAFSAPVLGQAWSADINFFPFNLSGGSFLFFYIALWAIGLGVSALVKMRSESLPNDERDIAKQPELSADELAVLAGGAKRLTQVALTRLYAQNAITATKSFFSWRFQASGPEPTGSELDRDLYKAVLANSSAAKLVKAVEPHYDRVNAGLQIAGLRHETARMLPACVMITLAIAGLGAARFIQGLAVQQEVGFLAVVILVGCVLGFTIAYQAKRTTAKGTAALEHYKEQVEVTMSEPTASGQPANCDGLALSVAVLGASAIADIPELNPLASAIPQFNTVHGGASSGCGSGCSSGGGCGGGGCGGGGCGGCGG